MIDRVTVSFTDLPIGEYQVESTVPVVSWDFNPQTVILDTETRHDMTDLMGGYKCISFYYKKTTPDQVSV